MSRPHTLGMTGRGDLVAGERNGLHKLTELAVKWARAGKRIGVGVRTMARVYGVNRRTLQRAIARKTWRRCK